MRSDGKKKKGGGEGVDLLETLEARSQSNCWIIFEARSTKPVQEKCFRFSNELFFNHSTREP